MYVQFFQLREMPFSITPDPSYLYMSPRHQEALGHLLYGTGQYGGFVQLTGEVGTGKTTIVRTLLDQQLHDVQVAMVHNPRLSEEEFVQTICDELGVTYPRGFVSLKTLVDSLNEHLLANHAKGRRTVLIIDEAQNLKPQVLEQVRLLTNLETAKEKLLRIMLIGQPELSELLARPDLRQLAQRITARYHLMPLGANETAEYVNHRLRVAGARAEIFTPRACEAVYRHSRGIPRLINIICDRAMLGAYSQGSNKVLPAMVRQAASEAVGELPGVFDPRAAKRWARIETAWAVALLVCTGIFVYWFVVVDDAPIRAPAHAAAAAPPANAVPLAERVLAKPVEATPEPVLMPRLPTADLSQLVPAIQPDSVVKGRLMNLWNVSPQVQKSNSNICVALRPAGLECYRGNGRWSDLGQMNRPAILTFRLPGRGKQYFLLRELGTAYASIDTAMGTLRFPLDELDKVWTGDFLVLWRRETAETFIGPDARSESIAWVWNRLAQIDGTAPPDPMPKAFDNELREALRRFQRERGMVPDGYAGIRTLISLGDNQASTPTLSGAGT